MNRAQKINRLLDKFGMTIDLFSNQRIEVFGQLHIVDEGSKWKVTFVSHSNQTFLVNGQSFSAFVSKFDGNYTDDHAVSFLSYEDSVKGMKNYTDEETFFTIFQTIIDLIDMAYLVYFPK